ncbi:MAG: HEAT repeat domain-containing protein [Gemmataceae bacterium]
MRVNLRTLLAYLDDSLEPAETRRIGQLVAENAEAQRLIQRIRDVGARRRVGTPPATGPGAKLDVNTIAEYLDGVLSDDRQAEVEAIALSDETYLAELISCHQILTLSHGETIRVPPPARQRMYALGAGRMVRRRFGKAPVASEESMQIALSDDLEEKMRMGVPLFSWHSPWARRWGVPVGVLALLVVLGIVIWQAWPSSSPRTDQPPAVALGLSPTAKPDQPITSTAPSTDPRPQPPDGPTPPPQGGTNPPDQPKIPIDTVPDPKPSPEHKLLGQHVARQDGEPSNLVQRLAGTDVWQRVPPHAPLASGHLLVSLPGYRSDLRLDAGAQLRLWGNLPAFSILPPVLESAVVLHPPTEGAAVDFTLDRGRVIVANTKSEEVPIRVRFDGDEWIVNLWEGAEASLELISRYSADVPFRKGGNSEGPDVALFLLMLKGQGTVKVGYQTFFLPTQSVFIWDNRGATPSGARPIPQLPDWARGVMPDTPDVTQARQGLAALNARLAMGNTDLLAVLTASMREPNDAGLRAVAVYSLGAVDAISALVDALEDSQPDVRGTAVLALRQWIGRDARHDLKLFRFLQDQKGYSENYAEIVMRLLHSFSEQEKAKPELYEQLIFCLRHDKLAIRELAYWHLVRMVPAGQKIPYDATGDEGKLQQAYKQWKQLIPDGKLPPLPMFGEK